MSDPRVRLGYVVEDTVLAPFSLVASRHTSPETGGQLDYGIKGTLPNGEPVVIGELFAAGIGRDGNKIRLDTKQIGERLIEVLNMTASLPTTTK